MFRVTKQCNTCRNSRCVCDKGLLTSNNIHYVSTSFTDTIPGPSGDQGEPGDTYVPIESDDIFTQ